MAPPALDRHVFRFFVYRKLLAGQHAFLHKFVVGGDLSAARPEPRFEYGEKGILEGIPAFFSPFLTLILGLKI